MIKLFLSILLSGAILFSSGTIFGSSKIDPFFDYLTQNKKEFSAKGMVLQDERYDVFIQAEDTDLISDIIEENGGVVRLVTGDIVLASISSGLLDKLSSIEDLLYIEAAKPLFKKNDLAMMDIGGSSRGADRVFDNSVTGEGVIIGIVDTGIDYDHPDFLDESGNSRVLYIWDQKASGGEGPSEMIHTYGTECKTEDINGGICEISDLEGHGTHVAGTAAGSDEIYTGVAPDTSIIAVTYASDMAIIDSYAVPFFSTQICEAAYYIFEKAKAIGAPAVVNLSLGTHIGPHDGTSLFELCLDSLLEGHSGRAIVAAAGNENIVEEGFSGLHAGYYVSSNTATNFQIRNFDTGRVFYIDIWGESGSNLNFSLSLNDSGRISPLSSGDVDWVSPGTVKEGSFLDGKIQFSINAVGIDNKINGKPHVGVTIVFGDAIDDPSQYTFDLLVSGEGSFDAWLFPDSPSDTVNFTSFAGRIKEWSYRSGDSKKSVTVPATAKSVIAVSAYTTRNTWGPYMVDFDLGGILEFSSSGPSANPDYTGQKPEIAAPGAMIVSTKSSDAYFDREFTTSDGLHAYMAGTSMAAPFVSGTVALLFSVNPALISEDAKGYIIASAYVDDDVGDVPNDRWGYGKLNLAGAVSIAKGEEDSYKAGNFSVGGGYEVDDVSGGSGGGCSLAGTASPNQFVSIFLLLLILPLYLFRYRNTN